MIEARCEKCGEVFNPSGEEIRLTRDADCKITVVLDRDANGDFDILVEHYATENGNVCGGFGPVIGEWGVGYDRTPARYLYIDLSTDGLNARDIVDKIALESIPHSAAIFDNTGGGIYNIVFTTVLDDQADYGPELAVGPFDADGETVDEFLVVSYESQEMRDAHEGIVCQTGMDVGRALTKLLSDAWPDWVDWDDRFRPDPVTEVEVAIAVKVRCRTDEVTDLFVAILAQCDNVVLLGDVIHDDPDVIFPRDGDTV